METFNATCLKAARDEAEDHQKSPSHTMNPHTCHHTVASPWPNNHPKYIQLDAPLQKGIIEGRDGSKNCTN